MKSLISIILGVTLSSCAIVQPKIEPTFYTLEKVHIVVLDEVDMLRANLRYKINPPQKCFYDSKTSTVFVPYSEYKDVNDKYLPIFDCLGHEIWHDKSLGGDYHK